MSVDFEVSRDAMRDLCEDDNEIVALAARVVYEQRYGEPYEGSP